VLPSSGAEHNVAQRSFVEANALGTSWCGAEHLLLAVLNPPAESLMTTLFSDLDITYERVRTAVLGPSVASPPLDRWSAANPAWHECIGFASGLAVASGTTTVDDYHLVLALLYSPVLDGLLRSFGVTRVGVFDAMRASGFDVPPVPPEPVPEPRRGTARVFLPATEVRRVLRAVQADLGRDAVLRWNIVGDRAWIEGREPNELVNLVTATVDPELVEIRIIDSAEP